MAKVGLLINTDFADMIEFSVQGLSVVMIDRVLDDMAEAGEHPTDVDWNLVKSDFRSDADENGERPLCDKGIDFVENILSKVKVIELKDVTLREVGMSVLIVVEDDNGVVDISDDSLVEIDD